MTNASTHPNSRIVTIFRAGSFLSRAQGKDTESFFSTTKRAIGSYWEAGGSKRIASGLSFDEEDILLPYVLDTPKEDREFRSKIREFYMNITTQIPHGTGLALEIGLSASNSQPVSAKNLPLKMMEYLRYRHAMLHPLVAANKGAADSNPLKEFYIFDKADIIKSNTKKYDEQDAALQAYVAIKSEPVKVDTMLTLLGIDPREFDSPDEKVAELRQLAEKRPAEFLQISKDQDLDIRYWIKTLINTGVFKTIGPRVLDAESSKLIGNTLEEAVYFFKDDENSATVIQYKAIMQEALKRPAKRGRKTVA